MKILLTLVFATMFYSAGFSQQVQRHSGEASLSQKPAVKAVTSGVKGIKESSSTTKNTAKIAVSTSAPASAKVEVSVKSPAVKKPEPAKIAAPLETVEIKPAAYAKAAAEQKRGFAVNKRHLVTKGETLWGLSQKYYKDPFKWGRIYNANINSVSNPDLIYPEDELEIPDITEEVKPAAQKEFVIGEDETMKEPELESSEILTAQETSVPADTSSAGKLPAGPVAAKTEALPQPGEKPEELFKRGGLSEEMPADQKEWSSQVKIVSGNWREDGVITSKAAYGEDVVDGLSFSGETVLVGLRLEGLVKKGDYLEAYLKGTSAYDKKGHRLGFELQRAGSLEVLSVDGKLVKAKVLDASTSISKGLIVKKK